MSDKYIENILKKIKSSIESGEYFIAGQHFLNLARYGTVIEDHILTTITSELADIYRNSLGRVKEYKESIDNRIVDEIKLRTQDLIDFLRDIPNEISKEKKIELFDTIIFIIFNGEKIQYETNVLESARALRKGRIRDFLL